MGSSIIWKYMLQNDDCKKIVFIHKIFICVLTTLKTGMEIK